MSILVFSAFGLGCVCVPFNLQRHLHHDRHLRHSRQKSECQEFELMKDFPNVFQPTISEPFPLKGKWRQEYFKNDNPIILELGCGKGEYSVGLAERYPNKNFVGIDIKGARFWRGAKTAVETGLHNVAFIRTQIELINHIFAENEVDEIKEYRIHSINLCHV